VSIPELLSHYLEFCAYRDEGALNGSIDLTECSFIRPTTLVPLAATAKINNWSLEIDANTPVGGYLSFMLGRVNEKAGGRTYVPPIQLPQRQDQCNDVLQALYDMRDSSVLFAKNTDAYSYVIGELVDNIYEHSEFGYASVMAQKYRISTPRSIELCFFDNGITIPGSYEKIGRTFPPALHYKAILNAISGKSTKKEQGRGYGLGSNVTMFRNAGGNVLIVSGSGAVFLDKTNVSSYALKPSHSLSGTLISLTVPDRVVNLKLYQYVEG
jgi:hypothetical protein